MWRTSTVPAMQPSSASRCRRTKPAAVSSSSSRLPSSTQCFPARLSDSTSAAIPATWASRQRPCRYRTLAPLSSSGAIHIVKAAMYRGDRNPCLFGGPDRRQRARRGQRAVAGKDGSPAARRRAPASAATTSLPTSTPTSTTGRMPAARGPGPANFLTVANLAAQPGHCGQQGRRGAEPVLPEQRRPRHPVLARLHRERRQLPGRQLRPGRLRERRRGGRSAGRRRPRQRQLRHPARRPQAADADVPLVGRGPDARGRHQLAGQRHATAPAARRSGRR